MAICFMAFAAASGNLLVNPGFESIRDSMPIRWDLFVMPQEGCYGEVDEDAPNEGRYCIKLHNGEPYDKEPANNWSQSIAVNLRNKELAVKGWIKTEGATEAALWLQCFQRNPLRIVAFASTGTATPVYGDTDWTEVEMQTPVPSETDFIMVRCVLLGEGAAWFDGLSVEDALQSAGRKPSETAAETRKPEGPSKQETKPEGPGPQGAQDSVDELRASRQALTDTNRTLRELNTSLLAQISALQAEVERLRQEIQAMQLQGLGERAESPLAPVVPWPQIPVPPLVPHIEQQNEDAP